MKTSLEDLNEGIEYTRTWYRKLPTKANLPLWISSARGLVGTIFPDKNSKFEIRMSTTNDFAGAVEVPDPLKRIGEDSVYKIIIGSIFIDLGMLNKSGVADVSYPAVSLMTSNGTVSHEAAHLRYGSLSGFVKYGGKYPNLFRIVFNVIEDLFIENMISQHFKPLYPFVKAKNAFLFSDRLVSRLPKDKRTPDFTLVDTFLTISKRYTDFSHQPMFSTNKVDLGTIATIAKKVFDLTDECSVGDRVDIAIEILSYLESEIEKGSMEMSEATSGQKQIDSGELNASGMSMQPGETTEMLRGVPSGGGIDQKKITRIVNILSRMDNIDATGPIAEIVQTVPEGYNELPMDDKYREISKHLRQMATQSNTFGPASHRGHMVPTRIYRVATDNKMFGTPEEITKYKKDFEICLLVDCSGSMHASTDGSYRSENSRIRASMRAAIGIKFALDTANIKCNVYGHTADYDKISSDNILMFKLSPHEKPASSKVLARRADNAVCGGIPFENNRDNLAVKWCGENGFSKSNNRKVLIVISDGQPAAHGFDWDVAISDTAREVSKVRAKGITVVSISICESAVEPNNRIYGSKSNVADNDPDVVVKIVEQIMASKI